jgi:hypothetical protein
MKRWIDKDGEFAPDMITLGEWQVVNPTDEHYREAGYMPYVEPAPTEGECLECVKKTKIQEIEEYDKSDAVNSLTVNGVSIWYDQAKRLAYKMSVDSAIAREIPTINLPLGEQVIPVPVEDARQMLATLQLYANAAYLVTMRHKAAVMALESEAAVKAYDFKKGYPEKISFTIE